MNRNHSEAIDYSVKKLRTLRMEMGDHSQIPLQIQFLSKALSVQVLYVKLYDKAH